MCSAEMTRGYVVRMCLFHCMEFVQLLGPAGKQAVTKTVTLRSGDMIWRYEDSRVESKIERQRITPACSRHTTSLTRKLHAARVCHTSFGARRGH